VIPGPRSRCAGEYGHMRAQCAGEDLQLKISMLQDLERGVPLEIGALVTAVQDMGRLVKVATPTIDTVLALLQERGRQAGLYRQAP
jgi:2-dehydropantoate 2-reductase